MGTRLLTLMRHGQAEPMDGYPEDFERPLTRRGELEAREMARRIVHRDLQPDLILFSPAQRAFESAAIVAEVCELDSEKLLAARDLYLAAAETIWRLVTEQPADSMHILICGHNPGLSDLASRFGPRPEGRELSTAGLATARWHDGDWSSLLPESAIRCDLDDPQTLPEF